MRRSRILSVLVGVCVAAAAVQAARIDLGDVLRIPLPPYFSNLLVIGTGTVGSVTIDAGTESSEDSVALGGLPGGNGTLTVRGPGSKLTLDGDDTTRAASLVVASASFGKVRVDHGGVIEIDGTANLAGDLGANLALGLESGGSGFVLIQGAGSEIRVRNGAAGGSGVSVGFQGSGDLDIIEGGVLSVDTGTGVNGGAQLGGSGDPSQPGGVGRATVTGPGSAWELTGDGANFSIGSTGFGSLTVENGAVTSSNNLFIAVHADGVGTVRVTSGGTVTAAGQDALLGFGGSANVGLAGNGELQIEDGQVVLDDQGGSFHGLQVGGTTGCGGPCPFTGGDGVVELQGPAASLRVTGPLSFATIGADGDGSLHASGGALFQVENLDDLSGTSVGFSPNAHGEVRLEGAGTLFDAGVGLSIGLGPGPDVDGGSAHVEVGGGAEIRLGVGGIGLGTEGTLSGNGLITGNVFNLRGQVEPGASTGTLSVQGDYSQSGASALLTIEVAGREPGKADRLITSGALGLDAGTVQFEMRDGFLPSAGDAIVFAEAGGTITEAANHQAIGAKDLDFEIDEVEGTLVYRALTDASGFGTCQSGQLKALSGLCKQTLGCEARRIGNPARDLEGTKRDACIGKAVTCFAKAWSNATAKGEARSEPCVLVDGAHLVGQDLILNRAEGYRADVLVDWDSETSSKADNQLRSALVKQGAGLCAKLLAADAAQMAKRRDSKWQKSRSRALAAFSKKGDKAVARATAKGVDYSGADRETLGETITTWVGDVTSRSAGLTP